MYVVKDWAGNVMYNGKSFETFDDAWGYIYKMNPDDDSGLDDFYAVIE